MDKQALQNSLDSLITEYVANNPRSGEMFERAKESLPGGEHPHWRVYASLSDLYRAWRRRPISMI